MLLSWVRGKEERVSGYVRTRVSLGESLEAVNNIISESKRISYTNMTVQKQKTEIYNK